LNRPLEHLQKYPVRLGAILRDTVDGHPDHDFLSEATAVFRNLMMSAQLRVFQSAMGNGTAGKLQWFNLVPDDLRKTIAKAEVNRQS
jgi:hypothetical protein